MIDAEVSKTDGAQLIACIRRNGQCALLKCLVIAALMLVIGILLTIRFRVLGAVVGLALLIAAIVPVKAKLSKWLHPESADVFRKYGTPDTVAARIRSGSSEVFFDNGRLLVTEEYMLDRQNLEMLLFYPNALTAYSDGVQGKDEYLIVYDKWGQQLRFPFTNGQQQIMKITILIDKVRKLSPACRGNRHSADMEYVRKHQIPLS